MGTCCFPRNSYIYRVETISNNMQPGTGRITELIDNVQEECFNDMPEVTNKLIGLGIKKMKAYKCDLIIDELNKLREHFWKVKISINARYKFLRQAILYDSTKCEEYIIKNGFYTLKGCINECSDSSKFIYKIPNYCINDPYFERVILPVDNKAHNIKLSIYIGENDVKTLICVEEGIRGRELKNIYAKAKGYDMNQHKIRLFFGGNEIKDNEFIYQHKICNNYIIQATKV